MSVTSEFVRNTVIDVLSGIAPELDPAALRGAEPLRDQIDLDSFDFLNVLIALKERLGVEVLEKDYGSVQTLDSLVAYLCARAAERPPQAPAAERRASR